MAENTEFLPAERAGKDEIKKQADVISARHELQGSLNAAGEIFLVLNKQRQILFANESLKHFLEMENLESIYGLRLGEALQCKHSEEVSGCGTTEFCKTCGAANAILSSLQGIKDVRECRIIRNDMGESYDFKVWATPYKVSDEQFSILALMDISAQKRREVLERTFFHDLMNTSGSLKSFLDLLRESELNPMEESEFKEIAFALSERLIDEIRAQRTLLEAEKNDLILKLSPVNTIDTLKSVSNYFNKNIYSREKSVLISENAVDSQIVTDSTHLQRILVNALKNALEASEPGDTITLSVESSGDNVIFTVKNPAFMPREIQLQLFNRSFSTKGVGRGIGTYSMKLLGEKYLKGKVWFESDEDKGTTFFISIPLELRQIKTESIIL